jgi:hypothetical protein
MTAVDKLLGVAKRLDGKLLRAVIAVLQQQGHDGTAALLSK